MRRRSRRNPNTSESTGKIGQELPSNQPPPCVPFYPAAPPAATRPPQQSRTRGPPIGAPAASPRPAAPMRPVRQERPAKREWDESAGSGRLEVQRQNEK